MTPNGLEKSLRSLLPIITQNLRGCNFKSWIKWIPPWRRKSFSHNSIFCKVLKVSHIYIPRIKDVNLKSMAWFKGLECDELETEIQFSVTPSACSIYIKMKKNRTDNIWQGTQCSTSYKNSKHREPKSPSLVQKDLTPRPCVILHSSVKKQAMTSESLDFFGGPC